VIIGHIFADPNKIVSRRDRRNLRAAPRVPNRSAHASSSSCHLGHGCLCCRAVDTGAQRQAVPCFVRRYSTYLHRGRTWMSCKTCLPTLRNVGSKSHLHKRQLCALARSVPGRLASRSLRSAMCSCALNQTHVKVHGSAGDSCSVEW